MDKNLKVVEEFAKLQEQWAKEDKEEEIQMKKEGYKFKIVYWVHPKSGGDDMQKVAFCQDKPNEKDIASLLRNSAVKNDYSIKAL